MSNIGGQSFSNVKKARLALLTRANEILDSFLATIKEARAAGKYEEALKAQQWLLEHIPADEGERLLESSIDKAKQIEGPRGPMINVIGITMGGKKDQKSLPESIIDITPIDDHS